MHDYWRNAKKDIQRIIWASRAEQKEAVEQLAETNRALADELLTDEQIDLDSLIAIGGRVKLAIGQGDIDKFIRARDKLLHYLHQNNLPVTWGIRLAHFGQKQGIDSESPDPLTMSNQKGYNT
ncbi:hypothetical protein AJ80_09946, partial [Polytolypa hystricis UAMH7299]